MIKEILDLFKGKDEQQAEVHPEHPQRSAAAEPTTIVCNNCGANNLISSNSACEYCGSPLSYKAASSEAAKASNTAKQASDLSDKENEYILVTGHYTAGIDIPVGTCNVSAVFGSGNLTSTDYGINEVFGTERGDVSSFKGLKLPSDVSLEVSGSLKVKLVYKSIDAGFSGRTYDMSGAKEISAGNYIAGKDFKTGFYNLVIVSGVGNISTEDCEVNEVMGFDEDEVREIKNACFEKGAELSLSGNLIVKLIPAVSE